MNLELEFHCSECARELTGELDIRRETIRVNIPLCENCRQVTADEAEKEGKEKGVEEGYDRGYEAGKKEGYAEGQQEALANTQ